MAKTRTEQKQEDEEEETTLLLSNRKNDDESESETLSLCDLPVNLPNANIEFEFQPKEEEDEEEEREFEFGVGSSFRVNGSDSGEPEMSTADELFFKGRILPFRHSVSLDRATTGSIKNRLITRSESVEFRRTGIKSDRIKNNFIDYSQPSPQPQIIRRSSSMTAARVNPKSNSIWDFLRSGLVRTPEIELRATTTAKLTVSRNSSCSSTSTSSNSKKNNGESRSRNRRRGFFFGDCKCSVSTEIMTVPVKMDVSGGETEKKKTAKKEEKSAMARTRTFEWLKELSQVGFVVDHGRRSFAA